MGGETEALKLLASRFGAVHKEVLAGIGDDSAVIVPGAGNCLVASTDTLAENVHFRFETQSPRQLGKKAVCVAASDIGAMGAVPRYLLCSLGCGKEDAGELIGEISLGVRDGCREFGLSLVGGNLCRSETVFINMTAFGEAERESIVLRSGARDGDDIYVTGTLGDSALGLRLLSEDPSARGAAVARHTEPVPRLEVGRMAALRGAASSMIDVSDGLSGDIRKITSDRGLGARISLADIPVSPEVSSLSGRFCADTRLFAVSGGEDYELLFTSRPGNGAEVREISRLCGVAITRIGSVTDSGEVLFFDGDGREVSCGGGFDHFG